MMLQLERWCKGIGAMTYISGCVTRDGHGGEGGLGRESGGRCYEERDDGCDEVHGESRWLC